MLKLQRHLKLAGLVATALFVSACNPYQIKSAQNDFSTSTYTYRMASLHGENAKLRELWLEDSQGSIEAMSSKNLRYACDAPERLLMDMRQEYMHPRFSLARKSIRRDQSEL